MKTVNKKRILLIELTIWLFILGAIGFIGINLLNDHFNSQKVYQVVFKDVDSLSVGSPVRFMGIEVGHVSQIKPMMDQVFVNFVITDKRIEVPPHSVISIEFTGIAGSKSIEIKPPPEKTKGWQFQSLITSEPIRVNSLMQLQTNISESIMDFSYSMLDMFGKGQLETIKKNIAYSTKVTADTTRKLYDENGVIINAKDNLATITDNSKKYIQEHNSSFIQINKKFTANVEKEKLNKNLTLIKNNFEQLNTSFEDKSTDNLHSSLNHTINSFNKSIQDLKVNGNTQIYSINKTVNSTTNALNKVSDFLNNTAKPNNIHELINQTKSLKEKTKNLNNNL